MKPCSYNRIALLALLAVMLHVFAYVSGRGYDTAAAHAAPPVLGAAPAETSRGTSAVGEPMTRAVQLVLSSFGYTITVDGDYGPQTTRVVTSWQHSNGLLEDGVAGPVTQASLGLSPARRAAAPIPQPTRSVEQLIRDIWPDDSEARALQIAWRESGYQPGVTSPTGCCHGIFQIHWPAHRGWLADYGVTSVEQLFDAETNIRMALVLFQASGGWGPWAL